MEIAYSDTIMGLNIAYDHTNCRMVIFNDDLEVLDQQEYELNPWSPEELKKAYKGALFQSGCTNEKMINRAFDIMVESNFFKKLESDYNSYYGE